MLAYQQLHKHDGIPGWLQDRTAVGEEYLTAQCAPGRSGPLCSSCARGYGMGPGNVCRKCPSTGRAGALVAYIVVRLVDVLLVTLFTCVMLLLWSYSRSCFAGRQGATWVPAGRLQPSFAFKAGCFRLLECPLQLHINMQKPRQQHFGGPSRGGRCLLLQSNFASISAAPASRSVRHNVPLLLLLLLR
jgi:hypothetical protein